MICLICRQVDVPDGFASVKFERDEIHLVIKNVPAWVCPSCGEVYVEEEVATRLLEIAASEMSKMGTGDVQSEYDTAQI